MALHHCHWCAARFDSDSPYAAHLARHSTYKELGMSAEFVHKGVDHEEGRNNAQTNRRQAWRGALEHLHELEEELGHELVNEPYWAPPES